MKVKTLSQFIVITIVLSIGIGAVIATALRVDIAASWDEKRCDPYVVPIAGFFKPMEDPRTATQFAIDNLSFCKKEYIQNALRTAATLPQALADAEAGTVGLVQDIASTMADVFFHLWKFCFETYSTFMDKMKGVAKLFHNFMINLYSMVERLNASALSIIFGLLAVIVTTINVIQVTLIVAIVVIGIIVALQVILFFLLMPISGLIITVTALVSVVVVSVATAIAAATIAELFSPGACFEKGTKIALIDNSQKAIEHIRVGDILADGGRVTATHRFLSADRIFDVRGVRVTGDHLIENETGLIPVREHPDATVPGRQCWFMCESELWCLTTSSRRITCVDRDGEIIPFADWEEIPDNDIAALREWYDKVWRALNDSDIPIDPPSQRVLCAEAGLSPDCMVVCRRLGERRVHCHIADIEIGDIVYDGPYSTTTVIGKVLIAGDQSTDAVVLASPEGPNLVTCATWVKQNYIWSPAKGMIQDRHPARWMHLYTDSGMFMLSGMWIVRDASDVGLSGLRSLVEAVVLNPTESGST